MPEPNRRAVLGAALALAAAPPAFAATVRADDPRLEAIIDPQARLTTLYADGRWCEGPCWAPALGGLIFSDVKANRILVLGEDGVRTFRAPSDNANGNTLDAQGRLVTCEHRTRRVVRREADGALTVLADGFAGKRLNSPNDAVAGPDGAIWFTDPVFGITEPEEGIQAVPEQAARRVYRIPEPGRVEAMTDALDQPNGLAFSPDGRILYVSEAGASLNPEGGRAIHAFPVEEGRLGRPRLFAEIEDGVPDGLKVDAGGRVFAACIDGVRIYAPDGTRLGRIATPNVAGNLALAPGRLFIAASHAIHAIPLRA
ncbi:SMP-30/gluconolactonase/LRE family protein [Methylobacterium dankookense]|uniref:Gluconolactonase n=1 Tax=Methylobacterium dankookense TaxID=560405 RepID=A0A564FVN5_9HYPH|nr:SMP-30/gluconolactonase/LRE family protein [Methylobacterium dankookense]GJD58736.1 Gluconolactonase [Methylobacterium dankookense]VUF11858.1 Gluconolactonase [Methylobacterium dankookense]